MTPVRGKKKDSDNNASNRHINHVNHVSPFGEQLIFPRSDPFPKGSQMSKPASNPFFETDFSKYMDVSKMMDMSKLMGDFKMPNVEALMACQRKNVEAVTSANQMAMESIQTFVQRQADIARQSFEAAMAMIQAVMNAQTPEEKMAKQTDAMKDAMERCVSNLKELTDMATRSQYQAMDAISSRVSESLDEISGMMKNGNKM